MPTRNGLMLPFEFVDKQLKAQGIEGHVDTTTGLFIPRDNEPARRFLTAAREIRTRKYSGTTFRRPKGQNMV